MSDARGEDRLCLVAIHAHPDDEASKGAGTVAKYAAEGIRGVLVCCTGGEEGEILNPAVDTPDVRENLFSVRMAELQASVDAIGYETLHLLGYRDSGMKDTETNTRSDNFANAPFDEAVERLVCIIRAERPQVVITYGDDREFYPHPDHVRVHEISGPAFDAAGDPERFPGAGEPWQPSKLYYTGWSARRVRALHETYLARGEESPYATWFERGFDESGDHRFTTFVDVGDFLHHRRAALLAHATQVDPGGFWMRLPDDVVREVFPWEEFALARTRVDTGVPDGTLETDLFAGLRTTAPSRSA